MNLLANITTQLDKTKLVYLTNSLNITARAWLLSNLVNTPLIQKSGSLVLANNTRELYLWQTNLQYWLKFYQINIPVYNNQNHPISFIDKINDDQPAFFILESNDLTEKFPTPSEITKHSILLVQNDKYSLTHLTKQLVDIGYQRQTRIYSEGDFSRRGNVLDIYPPNSQPLRIVLANNILEEIWHIDVLSQTKVSQIDKSNILPLSLPLGIINCNLLSIIDNKILIIYDEDNFNLLPNLKNKQIIWQNFSNNQSINCGFHENENWIDKLPLLKSKLAKEKILSLIASNKNLLVDKIPHVECIKPDDNLSGFENDILEIRLLTNKELFKKETKPTTPVDQLISLDTINPGDYVVHIDHGIGRYAGLTQQTIDGLVRENFELHYAEGDKLFVPIDRADRISKYIGLAKPKLHRLSTTHWLSLQQKIKQEIIVKAQRLLVLYAKRHIARVEPFVLEQDIMEKITTDFPFAETDDQINTLNSIYQDLQKDVPMDRLVCGDVGFGKTEIALRTSALTVLNNKQVAILCPTTILAQQHFDTFTQRLSNYGIKIGLLNRFNNSRDIKQTLSDLKENKIDIIIGTHRLLSNDIDFANLGLLIIDEEQKFGVLHKERLKKIRPLIHILTLSATPIPRTLNFSLAGIKPISFINTPPVGRKSVITKIAKYDETNIVDNLKTELARQGQTYYLYNQVETIDLKAKQLQKLIPQAKIGIAHGQLPGKQLAQIMHNFDIKKIDILVCSTIIENGLDLPNVNTLIVEQAPRFGLAQLYQLRGRIGRSERQAYAYFYYGSEKLTGEAQKRLQTLENATQLGDGFKIAKRDLEIRGVGNILGSQQHGQVKAIGLNLYFQLLEQAVEEIKTGKNIPHQPDPTIDLPIAYSLPDNLVANQEQKFKIYQQLSGCQNDTELDQLVQEKIGKTLPLELKNLITILKIKMLAINIGLESIDTIYPNSEKAKIILYFKDELDYQSINQLLEQFPSWQIAEKKIKIKLIDLGIDWLANLIKSLKILQKK